MSDLSAELRSVAAEGNRPWVVVVEPRAGRPTTYTPLERTKSDAALAACDLWADENEQPRAEIKAVTVYDSGSAQDVRHAQSWTLNDPEVAFSAFPDGIPGWQH